MRDKSLDEVLGDIEEDIKDRDRTKKENGEPSSDNKITRHIDDELDFDPKIANNTREKKSTHDDYDTPSNSAIGVDDEFSTVEEEYTFEETAEIDDSEYNEISESSSDAIPAEIHDIEPVKYTVKGDRSWNTREPYVINIDYKKLQATLHELSYSIYYVEKPESDKSSQGRIRRALLKNITRSNTELIEKYKEFIFKSIFMQVKEFGEFYNLKGDNLHLFLYHSGVFTTYRILTSIFQKLKIGYCYMQTAENKVVRHFPLEFIKMLVLNWFEDNINIYDLPFNGIHEYNEIKRMVSARYYTELEKYNKKLDEIIVRLKLNDDKNFNREEYYRNKWDEWFGRGNILVYNRFIERTIFKFADINKL